jgi:alkanesulfonate monooxygenase SsuD/methylene tetrahydromethanopterin reductase-like flavin-dependent oxidoreductase (luciferase family)
MDIAFGLNLPTDAGEGADPAAVARRAEELGFDLVSSSDHPCGVRPSFETWTLLTWAAAATSRIQIATRVLGMPYRAPAMVAKMAETLDRLSNGRLILGLGGGYSDDEFRAFGLGVPSPGEKIDGLEDGVKIIRGLWTEAAFSFSGRIHHTAEANLEPKPRRSIPIWLGTFGPRALAVTGRLADGWIPTLSYAPPQEVVQLKERVFAAARSAGRDPAEITCAYNIDVMVDERAESTSSRIAGPPERVAEEIAGFTKLGFSVFNFIPEADAVLEQAERLAQEVVPLVREAVA